MKALRAKQSILTHDIRRWFESLPPADDRAGVEEYLVRQQAVVLKLLEKIFANTLARDPENRYPSYDSGDGSGRKISGLWHLIEDLRTLEEEYTKYANYHADVLNWMNGYTDTIEHEANAVAASEASPQRVSVPDDSGPEDSPMPDSDPSRTPPEISEVTHVRPEPPAPSNTNDETPSGVITAIPMRRIGE